MPIKLNCVNNLWRITGLTGGGPANLDGVATLGTVPLYAVVLVITGGSGKLFQLQFSTLTPGPGVVVPFDSSPCWPVQWIQLS